MGKLSDRVRPGSEAAPWVVLEIGKLEAEIERLKERPDPTPMFRKNQKRPPIEQWKAQATDPYLRRSRMRPAITLEMIEGLFNWIKETEAEIGRLQEWQRQMVEKAADKSLDGYRELGAKCASLERERDEARLRHDDHCAMGCKPPWEMKTLLPAEPEVTALMKAVETDLEMHDASWRDVYERFQTGYTLTHEDRELLLCYAATITELRDAMDAARKRWPM